MEHSQNQIKGLETKSSV